MNAIGYIRISPYLQSIAEQETTIKDFCNKKGLNLLMLFKDNGTYTEDMERESWLAIEEYVRYHIDQVHFLLFILPEKITRYNKLIWEIEQHFKTRYGIMLLAVQ